MPDSALILFAQPTTAAKARRFGGAPKIHYPTYDRQMARISPKFNTLQQALIQGNLHITDNATGVDPEYTLVFETIGDPENFYKAVQKLNGLMNFASDIPFLDTDYKNVFQRHNDFLVKVKKIRNKLEHQVHNANIVGLGSNPSWFSVTYKVKDAEIDFRSYELISFVKDLNVLFSKIQAEVIRYAEENQKTEYRYYTRITRFDFCDFNKIYESDISNIIGKFMLPF